jgi:hypothetical protein
MGPRRPSSSRETADARLILLLRPSIPTDGRVSVHRGIIGQGGDSPDRFEQP